MAKHRTHSIEFKRQVVQEFLGGESPTRLPDRAMRAFEREQAEPCRRHDRGHPCGRTRCEGAHSEMSQADY
jgi:hypothetical protein